MRCTSSLAAALLFLAGSVLLSSQTLTVTPAQALVDETVALRASGLQPNEHVLLRASLVDGEDRHWQSEAEFAADPQGNLDLTTQAPLAGSYDIASSMGLVWSMTPLEKDTVVYHPKKQLAPQPVTIELLRKASVIATAQFEQHTIAPGVRQIKVEGKLHGVLFLPNGTGPHPGILVLGGSEGGLPAHRAAWLASRGYAAFALAYFRYQGLPDRLENIPLEYFGQALTWLKERPEVEGDHIGVMGVSRGGELALQLGALYPMVKSVVAYVPSNVRRGACCGRTLVPYAWTWRGSPLAFLGRSEHGPEELLAAISVEATQGPILLVAGEQDRVWDSAEMVAAAANRLKHHHFPFEVEVFKYPHAGHIAGRPEIIPAWHGQLHHPVSGKPTNVGGTPEGNALSSLDATPKVLDFLRRNLP